MSSEILQKVRLLDPVSETDRVADVRIEAGVVRAIADHISNIPQDAVVRDCTGLVLGTGLVDLYSHSGEPGFESRETLASLLAAAAAGGFTRIALLPNTEPAIDNSAVVEWFRSKQTAISGSSPHLPNPYLWGALTVGVQGQQMTELWELAESGIIGFADGQPIQNPMLLKRILEYAQPLGKPVALWCCDVALRGNGLVREGTESMRLGLPGVGAIAETAPLTALLELVAEIGTPVHLMRISTARSVELIAQAKAQGLPVTASTTWLHLLHNIRAVQSYNPNLRLEPPLGNPSDQAALVQAVEDGVLDAIAIDHTPYTYEEKTVAFAEAPPGAIGLELALPLLWQTFVASGQWSALTLWQALSTRPARCLGQHPSAIAIDQPAELTLFDPQQSWTVSPGELRSRSYNTSWLGQEIVGRVVSI